MAFRRFVATNKTNNTMARAFSTTTPRMDKVLCCLYSGGEFAQRQPKLLGCAERELGLREWIESQGHTLLTTTDKEGPNSVFEKEMVDADIVITTPFHPGYLTPDRIAKAKNLKAHVLAGIGSDHVDLDYIVNNKLPISVYEVTGSNVTSVAEHAIMTMLALVRNFVPAHRVYCDEKQWSISEIVQNSYDIEGKVVGTVAAGRIGRHIMKRLKPFNIKEGLYSDYQKLDAATEEEIGARHVSLDELLAKSDIVTINCPLHEGTKGLFNKETIAKMKPGAYLVNTARGAIVVPEDVKAALESGQLSGYGGDVSFPQPAPEDHPFRTMANSWNPKLQGGNAMTPHISGTNLDAQARYAAGVKEILSNIWGNKPQTPANVILEKGQYATKSYGEKK